MHCLLISSAKLRHLESGLSIYSWFMKILFCNLFVVNGLSVTKKKDDLMDHLFLWVGFRYSSRCNSSCIEIVLLRDVVFLLLGV